jgi:hypothetical protein
MRTEGPWTWDVSGGRKRLVLDVEGSPTEIEKLEECLKEMLVGLSFWSASHQPKPNPFYERKKP